MLLQCIHASYGGTVGEVENMVHVERVESDRGKSIRINAKSHDAISCVESGSRTGTGYSSYLVERSIEYKTCKTVKSGYFWKILSKSIRKGQWSQIQRNTNNSHGMSLIIVTWRQQFGSRRKLAISSLTRVPTGMNSLDVDVLLGNNQNIKVMTSVTSEMFSLPSFSPSSTSSPSRVHFLAQCTTEQLFRRCQHDTQHSTVLEMLQR